jgi:hypothetical protein
MDRFRLSFSYILAYLLWIVSMGLGVLALFFIREAYLLAIVVSASNRSGRLPSELFALALQARAADQLSIVVLGLFMIILIVYLEHYYRTAVPAGSLWARFSLATAIELGVLFLANAIYFSIEGQIRPVIGKVVYVLTFEALLVGLFVWLWFYNRRKRASAA